MASGFTPALEREPKRGSQLVKQGTTTFQVRNIKKLTVKSSLNQKPHLHSKRTLIPQKSQIKEQGSNFGVDAEDIQTKAEGGLVGD